MFVEEGRPGQWEQPEAWELTIGEMSISKPGSSGVGRIDVWWKDADECVHVCAPVCLCTCVRVRRSWLQPGKGVCPEVKHRTFSAELECLWGL